MCGLKYTVVCLSRKIKSMSYELTCPAPLLEMSELSTMRMATCTRHNDYTEPHSKFAYSIIELLLYFHFIFTFSQA